MTKPAVMRFSLQSELLKVWRLVHYLIKSEMLPFITNKVNKTKLTVAYPLLIMRNDAQGHAWGKTRCWLPSSKNGLEQLNWVNEDNSVKYVQYMVNDLLDNK